MQHFNRSTKGFSALLLVSAGIVGYLAGAHRAKAAPVPDCTIACSCKYVAA
jgi:hypothetical protein